ncbi:MAG: hypothetical protein HGA38_03315 [Candidatus Moranbacteria bacterium]|nr:hypothetical protein [Candidatus Moranbacteria bacterium]
MEKFWTVQNGLIGTAHNNRDGKVADFRPATIQSLEEYGKSLIRITPAKGVRIEIVTLAAEEVVRVDEEKDQPEKGMVTFREEFRAKFLGVSVKALTPKKSEWYDSAAQQEEAGREQAAQKILLAEEEAHKAFLEGLTFEEIVARVTRREIGRIKSGKARADQVVDRILMELLAEEFPGILLATSAISALRQEAVEQICSAGFEKFLLAREEEERAKRKAERMI